MDEFIHGTRLLAAGAPSVSPRSAALESRWFSRLHVQQMSMLLFIFISTVSLISWKQHSALMASCTPAAPVSLDESSIIQRTVFVNNGVVIPVVEVMKVEPSTQQKEQHLMTRRKPVLPGGGLPKTMAAELRRWNATNWDLIDPADVWLPHRGDFMSPGPHRDYRPIDQGYNPRLCMVARTYSGHAPSITPDSIDRFLASMLLQTSPDWHLIILNTDSEEFPYLHEYVAKFSETIEKGRIRVMAIPPVATNGTEQTKVTESSNLKKRDHSKEYATDPHTRYYYYTDIALREYCPESTEYVIVTNADNWYHPNFVEAVLNHTGKDMIGSDFASRYKQEEVNRNGVVNRCKALRSIPGCFRMEFRVMRLDVGAVALNYSRLLRENRWFFNSTAGCPHRQAHDACMIERLTMWTRYRIPQCLFSHAPNILQCRLYGGNILLLPEPDNRKIMCVHSEEAVKRLPGRYKKVLLENDFYCYERA